MGCKEPLVEIQLAARLVSERRKEGRLRALLAALEGLMFHTPAHHCMSNLMIASSRERTYSRTFVSSRP